MTREEFTKQYVGNPHFDISDIYNQVLTNIINEDLAGMCLKDGDTDHERSHAMIIKKRLEQRLITD